MLNLKKLKSSDWQRLFLEKAKESDSFPWDEAYILSSAEKEIVASSIQQFELGENSPGRTLIAFSEIYARKSGDVLYPEAVKAFIAEEQRHSALLRRFMKQNGISCLKKHWVNGTFKRIRKLSGLELSVMVLVSAEMIACPYYRALGRATRSRLLYKICRKIQNDERQHLYFQGQILMKLRREASQLLCSIKNSFHSVILFISCLVVWRYHRRVLLAGNYNFLSFVKASFIKLSLVKRFADPRRQIDLESPNQAALGTRRCGNA